MGRSKVACWIEAMRLRTLPVSLAGVIYAVGLGIDTHHFRVMPAILCLIFALLAQIASNFANEYYDFKRGFDRVGRDGPRRGVTEGDISPESMKYATYATLGVACVTGCVLVAVFGYWWMFIIGILTALGVMAYSTGPYPLSHHGLGEVAVVCFFGIIPVCLTYILMGGAWGWWLGFASVGIGLMGANVLIVNNYRDIEDDTAVGEADPCCQTWPSVHDIHLLFQRYLRVDIHFACMAVGRWALVDRTAVLSFGTHISMSASETAFRPRSQSAAWNDCSPYACLCGRIPFDSNYILI